MKMKLVVLSEGQPTKQVIPITLQQFLIGRDSQCHLRPVSPLISKRHCAVMIKDNVPMVRDLDSTNGTFVNEQRIKGEQELHEGDVLEVGPLTFRIDLEKPVAVNQFTPPPNKSLDNLHDDESIAALLMEDDGHTSPVGSGLSGNDNSDDSTEMDMMLPPELAEERRKQEEEEKKRLAEEEKKKGNTSEAAADILSQMYRRR